MFIYKRKASNLVSTNMYKIIFLHIYYALIYCIIGRMRHVKKINLKLGIVHCDIQISLICGISPRDVYARIYGNCDAD